MRIVDIGYSYQKLASTCHGRFMDFGQEKPVINPFMGAYKDEEDRQQNQVAAGNIVAEMCYSASGAALAETEWTLVKDADRAEAFQIDNGLQHHAETAVVFAGASKTFFDDGRQARKIVDAVLLQE